MNNETIQIRKATLDDLTEVVACARAAYSRYINRMGKEPAPMNADFASQIDKGIVFVAQIKLRFAGYVVYYPDKQNHLHLESVAVLPEMSGQGIGKTLVQHVEQAAQQKGLKAVELYTNETMTENLGMYPKMGYVEITRKQQDGFNRVFFRKEL